jgi:TetR/AcrR family transcriptional regulator, cholesterol catabolism regulator
MEEIETKDKILKGTEELFMKYGIRSVSMDDIARHLTVSKKTLYQHFADKEELVWDVFKNALECDKEIFDSITDRSRDAVEEIALLSVTMKQHMEKINPGLLYDLQKFHPKAWSAWMDFKNKFIRQSVIRNLKQGIAEGYYRDDINPEIMAVIRIESVQFPFNPELFPREKFKLVVVQEHLLEHFIQGLLTDKGRKLFSKYKQTARSLINS